MSHPNVAHRGHTEPRTKAEELKGTGHDAFHIQIGGLIVRLVLAVVLLIVFGVVVWAVAHGILDFWKSFTNHLQEDAVSSLGAMGIGVFGVFNPVIAKGE